MTLTVKRDAFGEFGGLARTLHELNRAFGAPRFLNEDGYGTWNPAVDIYEDQNGLLIEADMPGMKASDFELSVENNVLTLRGQRKFEKQSDEGNYHRVERSYGSFTRSFTLPATVNVEQVAADYRDGVLKVSLPRREEAKPRQIQVQINTEAEKARAVDAK